MEQQLKIINDNTNLKLMKKIDKIKLFDSNPVQYALYIQETDRFIILPEDEIDLIVNIGSLCDGSYSTEEILKAYNEEDNRKLAMALVKMNRLHLFDDNLSSNQFSEVSILSKKIFSFNISVKEKVAKIIAIFYWSILYIAVLVMFVVVSINSKSIINEFKTLFINSDGISYIISLLLTIPIFIVHELAHVASAFYFNIRKNIKINLALYFYILPYFYVKIPGMYTLNRRRRISIFTSGIWANLLMCLFFSLFYMLNSNKIILAIALSNFQIALVNLLPFNLTDGYFILSNLLKRGNLRKKYFEFMAFIGEKEKITLDFKEKSYIIISILYMTVFVFLQCNIYFISFFKGMEHIIRLLIISAITCFIVIIYMIIIKLRMKRLRKKENNKNEKQLLSNSL